MEGVNFEKYIGDNWESEKRRFSIVRNGLGSWWPKMEVLCPGCKGVVWVDVIIRDSNPFKTIEAAIRFVEKTKARIEAREAEKNVSL